MAFDHLSSTTTTKGDCHRQSQFIIRRARDTKTHSMETSRLPGYVITYFSSRAEWMWMTNGFKQSHKSKVPRCLDDRHNFLEYYHSFLIASLERSGRFYRPHGISGYSIDRSMCNTISSKR